MTLEKMCQRQKPGAGPWPGGWLHSVGDQEGAEPEVMVIDTGLVYLMYDFNEMFGLALKSKLKGPGN